MKKKSVIRFLQNILLAIELTIYVAYLNLEKVLFVSIIALDQYTKAQVVSSMHVGETIPIIPNFFHITYVLNPGAAFGIFPYQRIFFITIGMLLLVLAAIYYTRLKSINSLLKYGGMIAAAGATANMIDRIRNGLVIDFIDFRFYPAFEKGFPVFNIADVAIVIGMFVMMYVVMFKSEKSASVKEVRQP